MGMKTWMILGAATALFAASPAEGQDSPSLLPECVIDNSCNIELFQQPVVPEPPLSKERQAFIECVEGIMQQWSTNFAPCLLPNLEANIDSKSWAICIWKRKPIVTFKEVEQKEDYNNKDAEFLQTPIPPSEDFIS